MNCNENQLMTYHRVCNQINMTGVTSRAGIADPSGVHRFLVGFVLFDNQFYVYVLQIVLLFFFFWPSVLHFTNSDYPFGIINLFQCIQRQKISTQTLPIKLLVYIEADDFSLDFTDQTSSVYRGRIFQPRLHRLNFQRIQRQRILASTSPIKLLVYKEAEDFSLDFTD